MTQQSKTQFGYRRHPDQDRAGAGAGRASGDRGRRRAGRAVARDRSGAARPEGRAARRRRPDRRGLARDLLFKTLAGISGTGSASADRMVDKGVVWSVGKIFHGAAQLYQFNLLPEQGHKMPAFINLQQFYAEAYLVERVGQLPDRSALAQQGERAGAAQRSCGADGRDAGRAVPPAARYVVPATARARRCGRWSARILPANCSRTSF